MKLTDVERILSSSSQEDWIIDDDTGSFTYKNDLNLRIERQDYALTLPFNETWATNHPDPEARKVNYTVKYNNSFVTRETLVSIDGGRATLPMPDVKTKKVISKEDFNFANIVNINGNIGKYIKASSLQVK